MASRKGSPNKATLLRGWIGIEAKDPAMFLLTVMNDVTAKLELRVDAAKTLIPFVHRRQPVEVEASGADGGPITIVVKRAD